MSTHISETLSNPHQRVQFALDVTVRILHQSGYNQELDVLVEENVNGRVFFEKRSSIC